MRVTDHFEQDVLENPKRTGITVALCERIAEAAEYTNQQDDGLWRIWGYVPETGYWVRVVTSEDRQALITAHKDRNFTRRIEREGG
ncbi:MAG: hypothetical protein WA990_11615 [Rubrobacteraceae bacterium]